MTTCSCARTAAALAEEAGAVDDLHLSAAQQALSFFFFFLKSLLRNLRAGALCRPILTNITTVWGSCTNNDLTTLPHDTETGNAGTAVRHRHYVKAS